MECDKVVQACHCACGPQAPELQMILPKKKNQLSESAETFSFFSGRYSPQRKILPRVLFDPEAAHSGKQQLVPYKTVQEHFVEINVNCLGSLC